MKKTHLLLNCHQLLDLTSLQAWMAHNTDPVRRADQLMSLRPEELNCIFDTLSVGESESLLTSLPEGVAGRLLLRLHTSVLTPLLAWLSTDQLLELLRPLPRHEQTQLLASLAEAPRERLSLLLTWPAETVGAHMRLDYLALPLTCSVADAKRAAHDGWDRAMTSKEIYVVDKSGGLRGILSLRSLMVAELTQPIGEVMHCQVVSVAADTDQERAARMLVDSVLSTLPVEDEGRLVGVLHIDDAADILEQESTEDAEMQGGSLPLDKPYLETTTWELWRKRTPWLLALFLAEAYTGTVLRAFEDQLEAVIALAFFIPLLIGTGGNSGTQITTTIVRAMAVGEVSLRNVGAVLRKELSTAGLISLAIAVAAWVRAWMLGVGPQIGLVVTLTIIAIVMWSAIVSAVIPMVLRRLNIDPAVVSAPFISTLVDGTGLIIYFEIAKLVLPELQ
ncbi:magnesium transporter [Aeromonas simiae]|uniref:magnesium transporter n=1 Tax=Aeromonas simiae TaxID=218936 RepID=UPI00266BAA94|nr:magnesium transporter [Aeromonas simiae]MDO2947305.1 magnesium transporter [Aeromonas simiae]MDO2951155.1 magnesium transporter [Aeromonas simiae]MDO2954739.1 magnesium transporter [Aeromonas simiae]